MTTDKIKQDLLEVACEEWPTFWDCPEVVRYQWFAGIGHFASVDDERTYMLLVAEAL